MSQMQDTTSAMTEAESERGRLLEGLRAEHAAARAAARDGLEQVQWRRGGGWGKGLSKFLKSDVMSSRSNFSKFFQIGTYVEN